MRPFSDLAERARTWVWLGVVRHLSSGLVDDRLDELFIPALKVSGERRRHFSRITATGCAPDDRAILDGKTLLTLVDAFEAPDGVRPFAAAKVIFQSPLWTFLSSQGLDADVFTVHIQQAAHLADWHRIPVQDLGLYRRVLGEATGCAQPVGSTAYSAMLHKLANERSVEALATLAALFLEALHGGLLEEAMQIRRALRITVTLVSQRYELPELVSSLLGKLIDDRILGNTWIGMADWPDAASLARKRSTHQRAKDWQAFVAWYLSSAGNTRRARFGALPLVPGSARIDWLESNRAFLEAGMKHYHALRLDADGLRAFRPEKSAEVQAEAEHLLAALSAPAGADPRFYDDRPPVEIGFLPDAY